MFLDKLKNKELLIFAGGVVVGAVAVAALQSNGFKESRPNVFNKFKDSDEDIEEISDKNTVDIEYDEEE